MEKRLLVKIAKELNVATSTIVEHLSLKGFEIENKPTAKIDDAMYGELLKEFQGSIEIKEKADQLLMGTNRVQPKKEIFHEVVKPKPVEEVKPPVVVETKEVKDDSIKREEIILKGPKVVGKIDLDKPKPKEVVPPVESKEIPKPVEEKKPEIPVETPKEAPVVTAVDEPVVDDNMMRAETPELRGLKILGKIDTNRFERPKPTPPPPPAERPKPAPRTDNNPNQQGVSDADKKKRKRKQAGPINEGNFNQPGGQNRPGGFNQQGRPGQPARPPMQTKEVSQKEIDEKIKATMARLNVGKTNKRQKIRRDNRDRIREKNEILEQDNSNRKLQVTEFISVSELASLLNVPVANVIMTCMNLGVIVSINQRLDAEIIELVASEFEHEIEFISAEEQTEEVVVEVDDPNDLKPRAPIVTVMGHVDHGKTSLLDFIRKANVVSGEAGGITQHIGAYEVVTNGKKVTFLDTPGHEAFTAMRARGAKVTDVAVIIIAADDSIMPQTREAIAHAQAANVPIVFAINKIDKPGADPERIKNELAQMNFLVEEWGGKYQSQDISAKQGLGIEQLLEKILLEAEILDLKANPNKLATGTVLEASLDKGRGYVTKALVEAGTLKIGDSVLAGEFSGRVKAMFNERGQKTTKSGPSTPVLILGLTGAPQAGEKFKVMDSESEARILAGKRAQINREQSNRANKRISLDEIGRRLALGTFKELNLIVKGDVDGSIEALSDSLIKLSIDKVQVNVIHKAVGQIIESDVLLASASDAIIVGFQVRPSSGARKIAEKEGVEIKLYSIIYEAIEEVKAAIEGMLEPTKEEKITAQVLVREIFKMSKVGTIAGCYVEEGKISKNSLIRLVRDGIVIYPTKEGSTAELSSLKRFKEDVKEVKSGFECGLTIKNFNDIKEGDTIEAYEITEVKAKLD
ncbi:MAG: translation initiation factor IF-2 [Saprospiraceae bacterium]|nr:translation initiation factor IF-2 [Saprospiraceae bacterium]